MKDSEPYVKKLKSMFPLIKSNVALKALAHVIFRAEQVNSEFYPITIYMKLVLQALFSDLKELAI